MRWIAVTVLGVVLLFGVLSGYGIALWLDNPELPLHQVGGYDFVIYGSDLQCWDDPESGFVGYEGFGVSWPVEDEESKEGRPRLVALVTDDFLELVDYDILPAGFQEFVLEQARKNWPKVKIRNGGDTPDDPR